MLQQTRRPLLAADSSPLCQKLLCLDYLEPHQKAGSVSVADLVVQKDESGIYRLAHPRSKERFWLMPDYGDLGTELGLLRHCSMPALDKPTVRLGPYTPRIVIDDVVFQRRRWELDARIFDDACRAKSMSKRLASTFRVLETREVPRWSFYKINEANKPVYLDYLSPHSVELFLKTIRKSSQVTITEMMPDLQNTYLKGEHGPFGCELRMFWQRV